MIPGCEAAAGLVAQIALQTNCLLRRWLQSNRTCPVCRKPADRDDRGDDGGAPPPLPRRRPPPDTEQVSCGTLLRARLASCVQTLGAPCTAQESLPRGASRICSSWVLLALPAPQQPASVSSRADLELWLNLVCWVSTRQGGDLCELQEEDPSCSGRGQGQQGSTSQQARAHAAFNDALWNAELLYRINTMHRCASAPAWHAAHQAPCWGMRCSILH